MKIRNMRVCCSICKEIFIANSEVDVTSCGHIYHSSCIERWWTQKANCPQCRSRLDIKPHRIYFDLEVVASDSSFDDDPRTSQYEIDTLKSTIRLKDVDITKLNAKVEEKEKMEKKLKEHAVSVESQLKNSISVVDLLKTEMRHLINENSTVKKMKQELEETNRKVNLYDKIETLLLASVENVKKLVAQTASAPLGIEHLSVYVEILKEEMKRKDVKNEKYFNEYMKLKQENAKLKEDTSVRMKLYEEEIIVLREFHQKVMENPPILQSQLPNPSIQEESDTANDADESSDSEKNETFLKTRKYFKMDVKVINNYKSARLSKRQYRSTDMPGNTALRQTPYFIPKSAKSNSSSSSSSDTHGTLPNSFYYDGLGGSKKINLATPTPHDEFEAVMKRKALDKKHKKVGPLAFHPKKVGPLAGHPKKVGPLAGHPKKVRPMARDDMKVQTLDTFFSPEKEKENDNFAYFDERLEFLKKECCMELRKQGFYDSQMETEVFLHLRYDGTDCALMCSPETNSSAEKTKSGDFLWTFVNRYQLEFGFVITDRSVIVDDIRVRGVGKALKHEESQVGKPLGPPQVDSEADVFFDTKYEKTNVYLLKNLKFGHTIQGPAIIMDQLSTILVEPDCVANITKTGNIIIDIGTSFIQPIGTELDPIQLSIFGHRFMSIAEQMGRILQRTAISTNIKERLDFSCALFGPDGGLVSNAPHIPVHLGAMQETVQYQMSALKDNIFEGDAILSNHPCAGGSHLPDLTVITPVFIPGVKTPVFFVASRGHHADIGGTTPGSMPPHSTALWQEGATFKSFKLVEAGRFQQDALEKALFLPGEFPGCSGTRNIRDNIADLKAQIAANQRGIILVQELIKEYTLPVVQAYMAHIQKNAEASVQQVLKDVGLNTLKKFGQSRIEAEDFMDDGSKIKVAIDIDVENGTAKIDFSGSGYEVWGNCNAPRAITLSALIYCLRCLVTHDMPLNQGCLAPVTVNIPVGSILNPSDSAAVVGGNVLTSQRLVDTILKAFEASADSQGCMNNVTFGEEGWGYYETVAGGAGAGPSWHGRSGVHSHMTNTRITDPEILERRYPVILRQFQLRKGTGGSGKYKGGDGVIRQLLFRRPMVLSVLTERRVFQPNGLKGGSPGKRGINLLLRSDGRTIYLGSKTAVEVEPGDVFSLETPGGGGYGTADDAEVQQLTANQNAWKRFPERGTYYEYLRAQESV